MDKNDLFTTLDKWNFWNGDREVGVPRDLYVSDVVNRINHNPVPFVTGVRRCGKSYILRQSAARLIKNGVPRENILFINFEDPRFPAKIDAKFLENVYQIYLEKYSPKGVVYLFLDEIQRVYRWEQWVRTIHELQKAKMVVSGSNSTLLSPEFGTALTGRHVDIIVYPFSFSEYQTFKSSSRPPTLENYLLEGGFPEVVLGKADEAFLLNYFQDIVLKDLILRFKIREAEKIRSLARYFLSNPASLLSFTKTAKHLDFSPTSAIKFAGYLKTSFLVYFTNQFSWKISAQDTSPKKSYIVDTGLAKAVGFFPEKSLGYLAENAVYLELQRRVKIADNIFYFKDENHREVDFVFKATSGSWNALQVCYNLSRPEVKDREIKSLLVAMKNLNLTRGFILAPNEEGEEKIKGKIIKILPLEKWLTL